MIKLVDLSYHVAKAGLGAEELLDLYRPAVGYAGLLSGVEVRFIKHAEFERRIVKPGIDCTFLKSRNRFWYVPFHTHRLVKQIRPDVIFVQGLKFPLQLLFLRLLVGKKSRIVVHHHGEKPFTGIKKQLQRLAAAFTDAFVFTAYGNAFDWINTRTIGTNKQIVEILEGSTDLAPGNRDEDKLLTGMGSGPNFLWVGRLNANKDPVTVLKAFEKYLLLKPRAMLYMIYQNSDLLTEVQEMLASSRLLYSSVVLKGPVEHPQLSHWFGAADYYLSASRKEGSGYALIEAMACGCITIVTNIPPFRKITDNGACGFLFSPGNPDELYQVLINLDGVRIGRETVCGFFEQQLSYQQIATGVEKLCRQLAGK